MGVPPASPKASLLDTPDTWRDAQRGFWSDWSPRLLAASVVALVAWRATLGPPSALDLLAPLALLAFWPFHEWLIHVTLLHFEPRTIGPFVLDLHVAKLHRAHHADPWNAPLTFVPKRVYLHAAVAFVLVWAWLGPFAPWVVTTLAAYETLSLRYEWSHYVAHIRYTPRWAQRIKREHRLHHFQTPDARWGVSMTLADRVLRTDA